jgi:KAP family P-loop domain
MILPDNETRVDLLSNEAIAATIIKLLRSQHARPVTIGVHGDWGAGKSSGWRRSMLGFPGRFCRSAFAATTRRPFLGAILWPTSI